MQSMFKFVFDIEKKKLISFPSKSQKGYVFLVPSSYLEEATKSAKEHIKKLYLLDKNIVTKMIEYSEKEMRDEEPNSSFIKYNNKFTEDEIDKLFNLGLLEKKSFGYIVSFNNNIWSIQALFKDIQFHQSNSEAK